MQNPTITTIEDDFDLKKIELSGQCFRVREFEDGSFRFITNNNVLYIKKLEDSDCDVAQRNNTSRAYEISCSIDEWKSIWIPYFDLNRNYRDIRKKCAGDNSFIDAAMRFAEGIRVLNQDPWEMLVTFIISQRKNIPAISKSVNMIAEKFGEPISTEYETAYSFPTPEQLANATEDDFRACSLGYRAPYVMDAVRQVLSGELDLCAIADLEDEELFAELQRVHGVGKKVSNCVCLFAYGRTSIVPIDVWIARAIDEECAGEDPFLNYGKNAGIIQQFVFYYMTNGRR